MSAMPKNLCRCRVLCPQARGWFYHRHKRFSGVETVIANLRVEGYQPVIKEWSEDSAEIYVPDSDIYYEWNIVQSHLE